MDLQTILQEGKNSPFWKSICSYLDRRIEAARRELENDQLNNIDVIKKIRWDIKVSGEFKNIPSILLTHAQSQAKEKEK